MKTNVARILFAGVSSGCGKTTVVCAVLQALVNRGEAVRSFKCGPDYIDPMFHKKAIGVEGSNLDSFFYDDNTLRFLLSDNAKGASVAVIEGVMGYYDGRGISTCQNSTYELAKTVRSPVVLIINAKGMSYSVLAVIRGFLAQRGDNRIAGVILNNMSEPTYKQIKAAIEREFGPSVRPLGYLPQKMDCALESRHLGLITAEEVSDVKEKLQRLAAQAENSFDIDGIMALANSAGALAYDEVPFQRFVERPRIAVAMDRAFCFYYPDNLKLLERMGAGIIPFSPLADKALPECDGLYLCGGYPELYAAELANNESMRQSVGAALGRGLPCVAECGGFMYLTENIEGAPMVGAIKGGCENKNKLVRFGYVELTAKADNMLCRAGETIRAHCFHHYDAENIGDSFYAAKNESVGWSCIFASHTLYAGFPHIPFYSNLGFAENFLSACLKYAKEA